MDGPEKKGKWVTLACPESLVTPAYLGEMDGRAPAGSRASRATEGRLGLMASVELTVTKEVKERRVAKALKGLRILVIKVARVNLVTKVVEVEKDLKELKAPTVTTEWTASQEEWVSLETRASQDLLVSWAGLA